MAKKMQDQEQNLKKRANKRVEKMRERASSNSNRKPEVERH